MSENVNVLEGPMAAMRESAIGLLTDVAGTLAEMGDETEQDRRRIMDVARDLREMFFLVVVIGEFNAGKSSFINALLGAEVLPTGITPTTEVIELIRYSETPALKPTVKEDGLREWAHPNTGAPGVAIVDTPGTGSIFKQHEKIAKDFLHRSDLVIFVLSAKRAFADTERLYLEMARNYGKKIILVVNQSDLLASSEQQTVRRFIEQQVKETLSLQPLIFMVSAKETLASQGQPGQERGGVDAVRAHLRGQLAEAPPTKQKLLSQLSTGGKIIERYHAEASRKADLVKADTARVREVESELETQSLGLETQLTQARGEVDKVFEAMRQRGLTWIDANLSIRRIGRSVSREKLQQEFHDVVVGRALRDVNDATSGYINAVIDQSRIYWRSVIDRLNKLMQLLEQEVGGLDANIYAEQRESLEEAIRIAEAELKSYSTGRLVDEIQREFNVNMNGFTLSALSAFGGLLVALIASAGTPGPLFGAGAAALAGPAFVIAAPLAAGGSILALRYYRRITRELKQDFNERLDRLIKTYHDALDTLTRKERSRLANYGKQVLTPIFSRLDILAKRYASQQQKLQTYRDRLNNLRESIEKTG
ncbi:MAG: dynamin family protein [Chloroflexota bacterium]